MIIVKTSKLFFKEGNSDKIYEIDLVEENGGYLVNFRFGKRSTKLQTGTKTTSVVDIHKAESIYEKLINEKTSKGYTYDDTGTPYTNDTLINRTTYLPQLLNPIQEEKVILYLKDNAYIAQPKIDGMRVIVEILDGVVKGYNRSGIEINIKPSLVDEFIKLRQNLVLDGELVKSTYYVFDILYDVVDLRSVALIERVKILRKKFNEIKFSNINVVDFSEGFEDKLTLFTKLRSENAEGIVFKNKESLYEAGRPSSLGNQLKFKFITSASVIVTGLNDKRSVSIGVMDRGKIIQVGNVKIPTNAAMPQVNEIIEVQYLYAFKETNALFQPVFLAIRDDLNFDECGFEQLKYKADLVGEFAHSALDEN
jgi:bifunctional non-homologous end joining protein LigD